MEIPFQGQQVNLIPFVLYIFAHKLKSLVLLFNYLIIFKCVLGEILICNFLPSVIKKNIL
jgi:hypothetical protein